MSPDCHSGQYSDTWVVRRSKKEISPSEVRKRGSIFNAWWPVHTFSDHAYRSGWEDQVLSGYLLLLEDRLAVAPDLDNPVIENLEILPRFPGREYPDLPGYDSGFLVSSGDPKVTSKRHTVYRHKGEVQLPFYRLEESSEYSLSVHTMKNTPKR